MYIFRENQMPDVYTDFVVLHGHRIMAISLIGGEMGIKAYRGKFMDSTMARIETRYSLYDSRTGNLERTISKPAAKFTTLPQVKHEQALQVVMIQDNLLWGISHEDMLTRLYQHLTDQLRIPTPTHTEPEYEQCLSRILEHGVDCGYLIECDILGDTQIECYLVADAAVDSFQMGVEEIISSYISEDISPDELMEGINGIADYIFRYAEIIGEKIGNRVTYLHLPGEYESNRFDALLRTLLPQQKEIVAAGSKRLNIAKDVIIAGEMGTGKTTIGTAICEYHTFGHPYRAFVSAPGHLVEKWAREVKDIVPGAVVYPFLGEDDKPWEEFYKKCSTAGKPEGPEYWIVSNEALRGGYLTRPAFILRHIRGWDIDNCCDTWIPVAACPKCGNTLMKTIRVEGEDVFMPMTPEDFAVHNSTNHKCHYKKDKNDPNELECGEMLWCADNQVKGYRKVSIADIVKKCLPNGFFTYYIPDEVHKYKGSTAQGMAFGGVISKVKKVIAMTGTLADGYANGLYYLLWRMDPRTFKAKGYYHNEESRGRFQHEYGFWQKVQKLKDDSCYGRSSRARKGIPVVKPLPGYTINTFPEWLIERTCFLKLSDVAPFLPPKYEFVNAVEMDEEMAIEYNRMKTELANEVKLGGNKVASLMLHTLLSYPDIADGPEYLSYEKDDHFFEMAIPKLNPEKIWSKERELQQIIQTELALGRKCLVFTTYTGIRDCLSRLEWVVSQVEQADVQVLRSRTVPTKKRERYIKRKLSSEGKNVLICHPELVETGLDILECPTVIWVQTGYNVNTVRQASRRGWRIGQTEDVKIIFLCYKDTLQEACFQLVGAKLNAAGILEGNLSNEGLRNFGPNEGISTDILSLLKDSIIAKNSNDIFDSYKAEVALLLSKPILQMEDVTRLKTLREILSDDSKELSGLTTRQKNIILAQQDQLVLFG